MKQFIAFLLFFFVINISVNAQRQKEYYFKFSISNTSELDVITDIISIDNVKKNEVFAYAMQYELEEFQKLGYKLEFLNKETPKSLTMATTVAQMDNWDRYPTYEVYREMMKNFAISYPAICKLDSIGATIDGRQLYILRITDNIDIEENEPEFFYTSTMHGDETTGFVLMLRLADSLLSSYNSEVEIKHLIDEIDLYINPNANPDGTYASGNNTVSGATRSNGFADLNRDYPDPRTGEDPPYQPETQAMIDFANAHHFVMSANFHDGEEVMNYPWDTWYTSENLHTDTDWYEQVCTDYVTTARTVYSDYMKSVTSDGVTHGATWYKIAGGRQDYMNYWHQCREVTVELSEAKLLETEYLNNYWNYNKQSLIDYMKESLYGIRGTITNTSDQPLDAMVWVINHDDENDSSMVFSDPYVGNYHRLIEPGTYDLVASADGYVSDTIKNVIVNQGNATWVNFKLSLNNDSILLNANPQQIQDTLFFDETAIHQLIISNDSNALITNYTIELESNYEWIELNKNSGVINQDNNDTVLVSFDTDLLNAGNYYNNILLTAADSKIDTIPITLLVRDTIIVINPFQITDTVWAGKNPQYEITIKNNDIVEHNYDISIYPETNWINLDNLSGTLLISETDTVLAHVTTNRLGFGNFNCNIIIEKESSTSDTIPLSLFVKDTIMFNYNFEEITDTLNQDTVAYYNLIIGNIGYSNISYIAGFETTTKNNFWISTNDTLGIINPGTNDTVLVKVNTNNLNPGDYASVLNILESGGKEINIPINIHVNQIQSVPNDIEISNFKLYPNPFKTWLIIEFNLNKQTKFNISIYDSFGTLLRKKTLYSETSFSTDLNEIFNIQSLSNGFYLIQVSTKNSQRTLKVIKQ